MNWQVYTDFVAKFQEHCKKNNLWGAAAWPLSNSCCAGIPTSHLTMVCLPAGSTLIEICLGLGPCGELRYPAYQEAPDKWSYMGRGDMSVQTGAPSRPVLPPHPGPMDGLSRAMSE